MTARGPRLGFSGDLLRPETGDAAHRVTFVELFFDLVFVFAVTQVSHILIQHQDPAALVHSVMLTVVVWWVWVYTTWASNWLNPERGRVRGMLIALMLFGMLMASAIPHAFAGTAVLFAVSLTVLHLTRSIFTALAFARHRPESAINFVRISCWHAFGGVAWIGGAFAPQDIRLWIWLAALVIDLTGPRVRFAVPMLGRSSLSTWNVSGEHMSERVSLFFIIALGESIIVTGTAFSAGKLTWATTAAFLAAFASTVLMWLLYFNRSERGGSLYISRAAERGLIAQVAYTYIPALLVIGIVLTAVADELILAGPLGRTPLWTAGLLCGASAIYLLGNALFKRAVGGPWLITHLAGIVALAVLFVCSPLLSPLVASWICNAVLLVVVITDEQTWRRLARARATS